jgi:hypothetical protein
VNIGGIPEKMLEKIILSNHLQKEEDEVEKERRITIRKARRVWKRMSILK